VISPPNSESEVTSADEVAEAALPPVVVALALTAGAWTAEPSSGYESAPPAEAALGGAATTPADAPLPPGTSTVTP
jgi:hypothetical protein